MKHLENKEYDRRLMREALEIDAVPAAVERRLRQVYAELPDEVPTKRRAPLGFLKKTAYAVSGLAAAFLLLFGTNAAFPAFAEGLPVVGKLFQSINRHDVFQTAIQGKTIQGTNVASYGAQKINAVSESGAYTMTVEEGLCDGQNLILALRMEVPQEEAEPMEYILPCELSLSANGADTGLGLNDVALFPSVDGGFVGTVTAALPQPAENGEKLEISFHMGDFGAKDKANKDFKPCIPMSADFTLDFDVTADLSGNRSFSCQAEDNGVKLLRVESLPTATRLTVAMPGREYVDGDNVLLLESGKSLHFNRRESTDITEEIYESKEDVELTLSFDGVPAETEKAVFRHYKDSAHSTVLAESTLDLANGTAAVSHTYEEDGPLNPDSPFNYFDYRFLTGGSEQVGTELESGFTAGRLLYDANEATFTITVEKAQGEYREIKVEVLNAEGTVVASDVSEYNTATSGAKTYWDETTPHWESYCANIGENAPNLYEITTPSLDYLPAYGEILTVRVTDTQTGEELTSREIAMTRRSN